MSNPDICIYHAPCADGFTAAWAIYQRYPGIEFVPGVYGQEPPAVDGKHVLLVDFSYKRPVLERMAEVAASVTILDHHKTAEADLTPLLQSGVVRGEFDMDRSGARMAWDWVRGGEAPWLVRYVEDRDLWRFNLPDSREVNAAIFSHRYTFDEWTAMHGILSTKAGRERMAEQGRAIERKHFKDIEELLSVTRREMIIGGHRVPVANLPYTLSSDGAGKLAEGQPFGACYYDNAEGKRVFSLRSRDGGVDVSAVAASYGGGGHAKAAGFTAPPGWEGDTETRAAA